MKKYSPIPFLLCVVTSFSLFNCVDNQPSSPESQLDETATLAKVDHKRHDPSIERALHRARKRIARDMNRAARRAGVTIDTDPMVIGSRDDGQLVIVPILDGPFAKALIYFSFQETACGSNTLPPGFYMLESVLNDTSQVVAVIHKNLEGRIIFRYPVDTSISHNHTAIVGVKLTTPEDPDALGDSVNAWFNSRDGGTHIEYDLTNGE